MCKVTVTVALRSGDCEGGLMSACILNTGTKLMCVTDVTRCSAKDTDRRKLVTPSWRPHQIIAAHLTEDSGCISR